MKLNHKIVLITGGAKGIGKASAIEFASEGAFVYIADVDVDAGKALEKAIRENGHKCKFVKCDVANGKDARRTIQRIEKASGRLDVIYNNASIYLSGKDGRVTEIDEITWNKIIGINLNSIFLMCKYGIPLMLKNGGGSIINTASSAGIIGIPGCDAYTAAKGATVQLTKSMAVEYGPLGIRVNCIAPAAIQTDMMQQSNPEDSSFDEKTFLKLRTPLRRYGTPEEISKIACFLASNESSYLNGTIIIADGGITINGDLSRSETVQSNLVEHEIPLQMKKAKIIQSNFGDYPVKKPNIRNRVCFEDAGKTAPQV